MSWKKRLARTRIAAAITTLAILAVSMFPQHASARIECEGNFQVIYDSDYDEERLIATPYCEDNHLARVAREYGMRVSNEAVRYNPGVKQRACRLVGYDIRVKNACTNYLQENDRNIWQ